MYTQKNSYKKFILIPLLFLTTLVACRRDEIPDTFSPAYHIAESEKLVIPAAIDLPANPNGNARVVTFYAEGVQKYKSQLKAGSTASYEWVFVAPEADLYNAANLKIGKHAAGPIWQLTMESRSDSIIGQQFSPARSATSPDPNNIDWLLLMPKAGKQPSGVFSDVCYIQRIATKGGKAPATLPLGAGETIDVKYTAIYRFTKKNP